MSQYVCHITKISVVDTGTGKFPQSLTLILYYNNKNMCVLIHFIKKLFHIKLSCIYAALKQVLHHATVSASCFHDD